ncbi:porin, partial [uncultured Parasutterella sp.]
MIKFKPIALMLALGAFYCQGAFASQVTLYGKIDEGLLVGKTRHGDATFDVKSGFTAGSRWGIKGVEDLGNGLKVGFILEQGYNVDDGAATSSTLAFNRETALYVDGGFGRLTFGRLGT